jgi:hypothetical protein
MVQRAPGVVAQARSAQRRVIERRLHDGAAVGVQLGEHPHRGLMVRHRRVPCIHLTHPACTRAAARPRKTYSPPTNQSSAAMPCHAMPCHAMPCHDMLHKSRRPSASSSPLHAKPCQVMLQFQTQGRTRPRAESSTPKLAVHKDCQNSSVPHPFAHLAFLSCRRHPPFAQTAEACAQKKHTYLLKTVGVLLQVVLQTSMTTECTHLWLHQPTVRTMYAAEQRAHKGHILHISPPPPPTLGD